MASVDVGTAATKSQPSNTASNKKPRKNPARRKADRVNTNVDTAPPKDLAAPDKASAPLPTKLTRQISAPPVLNNANPTRPSLQSKKSAAVASSESKSGALSSAIVATKQSNGTPARTEKQSKSTTSATTSPRPSIRRSYTSGSSLAFNAPALVTGGLIGCAAGAAILMAVHVWYDFAGVKAAIATARAARMCVDNLSEELITSLSVGTYSTDEALDILRRTTLAYASMIPDGGPVIERIFREISFVRQTRGADVDKVLAGAYEELRAAGDKGMSAVETRNIVLKHLVKLSLFASRATQDVLTRNPRLKPLRDGAVKALKEPPRDKVPTTKVNLVVKHR
jgi:hypothetical protein